MNNWEKDSEGRIATHRLTGFRTISGDRTGALLRLEFVGAEAHGGALQLSLSARGARGLALSLLQLANGLEEPSSFGAARD